MEGAGPPGRPNGVVVIGNEYTYRPEVGRQLLREIEDLRILLEDDHAVAGTMDGGTVAALKGDHLRAVHRDVHDTLSGDRGSRIDIGGPKGPRLVLKAMGPDAPAIDVRDPRAGMVRTYDSVVPSILQGILEQDPPRLARARLICALLLVDVVSDIPDAWSDWHEMEISFPTPLAPLHVRTMRHNSSLGRIHGQIADAVGPDHPARRLAGALSLAGHRSNESGVVATLTPAWHTFRHDELPAPDPMERLRLMAEIEDLLR